VRDEEIAGTQMRLKEVIAAVNAMRRDGIIEHYAIDGAVGATFYIEPIATVDVDVFVSFKPIPGQITLGPQPVFRLSQGARRAGGG
jgi:hypothetical protein